MRKAKKKCFSILMLVFIFSQSFGHSLFGGVIPNVYAEGTGKENDPIKVRTVQELQNISKDLSKHYILAADIEFDGRTAWKSIGTSSKPFTGSLDGNGYKIKNLSMESATIYNGLFGYIAAAKIKNLVLEDVKIKGKNYTGGIAGYSYGTSLVENCVVIGVVEGGSYTGGLIGNFSTGNGQVKKSTFSGEIKGESNVGGVAGNLSQGQIFQCSNTANITGKGSYIGGIVGQQINSSTVKQSYNLGNIKGLAEVGGIVGKQTSSSVVKESYSLGEVNGGSYVGGIVGYNYGDSQIIDAYNRGDIIGTGSYIGGIVGKNNGTSSSKKAVIKNCYTTGDVRGKSYIGGITGYTNLGTIMSCASIGNYVIASSSPGCRVIGKIVSSTVGSNAAYEDMTVTIGYITSNIKATNPTHASVNGSNIDRRKLMVDSSYLESLSWDFDNIWMMPEGRNDYPILRNTGNTGTKPPQEIKVTGVKLSDNKKTLKIGDTYELEAVVSPENATNKEVIWTSNQSDIVSVSENGLITAKAAGSAIITVITKDGNFKAACEVTVEAEPEIPNRLINLALNKRATSNSVSGSNEANNAVDGDYGTRWTAQTNTSNVNLTVEFGKEVTFEQIKIVEHLDRISNFKLQYLNCNGWVDFHTGTTIGDSFHISFDPITTSQVRLLVISTKGTNGASIFEFEVYGEDVEPGQKDCENLALNKTATASHTSGSNTAQKAIDGDIESRWTATNNSVGATLEIDFGEELTFNQIKLFEGYDRVNGFSLQYYNGTNWIDCYTGTEIGEEFTADFENVTSSKVRLYVSSLKGLNGAAIYEFEVYNVR